MSLMHLSSNQRVASLDRLTDERNASEEPLRDGMLPLEAIVVWLEEQLLSIRGEVGGVDGGEVDAPRHGGGDHSVHYVKHLWQGTRREGC